MHLYRDSDSSSFDEDDLESENRQLLAGVRIEPASQQYSSPLPKRGRDGAVGAYYDNDLLEKSKSCCCRRRNRSRAAIKGDRLCGCGCPCICTGSQRCCGCLCRNSWTQNLCSILVGATVGVAVFWGTTFVLYAISVNNIASLVCGALLLVISCTMAIRAANPFNGATETAKVFTLAFTVVLFLAAIFCFLLDKKVILMSKVVKIPLYTVVNVALTFAITFPFSGLIHAISFDFCIRRRKLSTRDINSDTDYESAVDEINRRPNSRQTCTMFTASVLLGLYYGIIFGLLDIEDALPPNAEGRIFYEAIASVTAEAHTFALDRCVAFCILRHGVDVLGYCWFASIVCAKQGILPSRRHSCWSFSGHDVHITEARGSSRTIRWITSASHGQSVDYPVYRHVCEKTEHQNADVTVSSINNGGRNYCFSLLLASISKQ